MSNNRPTLLFKSSFGEGVYLEPPYPEPGVDNWWQHLKGQDDSGFAWPIEIWGKRGLFQMITGHNNKINDFIENRIETVTGPDGKPTRALHQIIKQKDFEWTQDPYSVYTDGQEGGDLYLRYNLKFPKNLAQVMTANGAEGWLTFCEWKTTNDYRLAFYVYVDDADSPPYWYVHGDNVVGEYGEYKEFWYEENKEIPVPEDEWFTVEIFWHRSTGADGRVWWAVNGNVIADHYGPNKLVSPINILMLFTAYAGATYYHQWVTDIEIWDGFPCGEGQPCYQKQRKSS